MNDESAPVPAEQKEVQFYGDELTAAPIGDGFVSARHLCHAQGPNRASWAQRMRRDAILADEQ